jgi:hypothetical protein
MIEHSDLGELAFGSQKENLREKLLYSAIATRLPAELDWCRDILSRDAGKF